MPAVRSFSYLSDDYQAAWELRRAVLLDPFSIDHDAARVDDAESLHFGIFERGRCMACLFLVPRQGDAVQMRQVAVAIDSQRHGLGRRLVEFAEVAAQERGFRKVFAHARHTAIAFYSSLGYDIVGEPFEQVGIEHRLVERVLGT